MSDKKSLDIPMKDISPESLTTTKTSSIDEEEKEPSVWRNFADSFKPPVRHHKSSSSSASDLEDRPSQFESEVVPVMEQGLKKRQLQMMALSGCVGSGLLVASGIALKNGGPAALLLAWAIVSTFLYCTMQSLAELSSMYKASGSFAAFSIRFIDPSWGTAMGLNYALFWIIVNPLELVASSMTISFWPSHINTVVWVAVFYVLIFGLNLFGGVRGFGETEFIAGIIKLLGVVGFNILAIILICGGGDQGYIGGKNWHPAFTTAKGTISCLLTATYSLAGTELVGLTSGEIKESRKVLPKAIKQVVWRIIIFYLLTLTLIGFLVPASSDELLGGGGGASASPFVIAIRQGGIKVLPSIFNVVVLVALLAIANSAVYGYSRTMFGLAEEGVVPKIFKYVDRKGRPLFGIATAAIIGLLGFVSASKHQDEVFAWLVALSGLSTLFTWGSINGAYIRFRGAMAAQGRSLDEIPYKSNTGVWGAYYGLIMNIAVLGLQFWLALFPLGGKPKAKDFFQTYLAAVIVLALYIIHKVWTKNWRWVVPYEEIDLDLGRTDVDMDTLKQEIIEEKERLSAKPWYYRWYQFWC